MNVPSKLRVHEILEAGDRNDKVSLAVDILLISLILISCASVILETVPSLSKSFKIQFQIIEIASVLIFSIEYLLRIWSVSASGENKYQGILGHLRYAFSGLRLVDFFAVAPFYASFIFPWDLAAFRIIRVLRLLKLAHYFPAFELLVSVIASEKRALLSILGVLIVILLLVSSGIYYFEKEAQPDAFSSIPESMWWAVVTLTTVGYGDVSPITVWGKLFAACVTVLGIGIIALPAGLLASRFSEVSEERRKELDAKIEQALDDGVVTQEEEKILKKLGMTEEEFRDRIHNAFRSDKVEVERCPHCNNVISRDGSIGV